MITDYNFLAYEFDKGQFTPKPVYPSGERDENKFIDKYTNPLELPCILTLDFDILDKNGFGLKKGFYNITADKYLDYILIYQSGKLKAKVPIIEINHLETMNSDKKQKVKKMSYKKYLKEQEKEKRKYLKGIDPDSVDYKTVEIIPDSNLGAYIIKYTNQNLELKGIIKL